MDVGIILKLCGIGMLVTVTNSILSKSGRDEQSVYCTIAGIIIALVMLVGEMDKLLTLVRNTFGL